MGKLLDRQHSLPNRPGDGAVRQGRQLVVAIHEVAHDGLGVDGCHGR